jgi:excinuclease UvrABC nuclease subunit
MQDFNPASSLSILSIVPVVVYSNADLLKTTILKDNKQKTGIYYWTNLLNNKTYVGSSINLGNRFRDYFKISYLMSGGNKNMIISKALLKYGYSNFKLEILEYCNEDNLRNREQHYLDLLQPEYNILKIAGSSLGFKHNEESLSKLRLHLSELNFQKGIQIEVTDTETNIFTSYDSIRKAAEAINCNKSSLVSYDLKRKAAESLENEFKLFKKRYIINIKRD